MAWSAPRTWSVSEVVTAAMMNAHVRDNLKYLKGQAGAVAFEDNIGVTDTSPTTDWTVTNQYLTVATAASPGSAGIAIKGARAGSDNAFAVLYGVNLSATGTDKTGGAVVFGRDGAADSANISFQTRNAGTVAERMRIDKAGNIGLGTTTPQSVFHAKNATTGGGMLFFTATAVAGALQTPIAAGTVAQSAQFWGYDRNNTGAALVAVSGNMLALAGTFAIANTDTVTVTLTAGGAITVQRTAGTNGTHEVQMLVLYK